MHKQRLLIVGLMSAAVIQVGLIVSPVVPLGIPGEWDWQRHRLPATLAAAVLQFMPAVFGSIVLLGVAVFGNWRLSQHRFRSVSGKPSQAATWILLFLLTAGSWGWLKTVERCAPVPHRNLKSLWVLYDPSSSGYFYEAAFSIDSVPSFLASYSERIQGEVLHIGTHPPGLFLLSHWAIQLCQKVPFVAERMQGLMFRSDVASFRLIEGRSSFSRRKRPLRDSELAALGLVAEMTTFAAALTVIPLFYLVRLCFDALIAWRVTCLWATLPCLAVFLPKSDVLFSLTSMSAVSLGVAALASPHSLAARLCSAMASGFIVWCGLMVSLAHLPVVALLGGLCCIRMLRRRGDSTGASWSPASTTAMDAFVFVVILGTIAAATVAFNAATNCNMLSIWQTNLANHGAFYEEHTRTVWKWLIINPPELGMAVGLPVALCTLTGSWLAFRSLTTNARCAFGALGIEVSAAVAITVAALWLSGRNSGEAARLWCFLTPWLLVLTGHLFRAESESREAADSPAVIWYTVLVAQIIVCASMSGRVSGFSF
ncbi:MAG: hypothetical protein ABGZ35_24925 [Planctomycetaceae bacterium]